MARRGSGSLFIGLLGSAALHAGLALAVLLSPSSVGPADPADPGQSVLLLPPPHPEPQTPPLGLPDESATGKAWLGVLEPTPHAARAPGQSEQAALSPQPADAVPSSSEAGTPGLSTPPEHRNAGAEPSQTPASMVPVPRPAPPPRSFETVDAPSTEPLILEVSRPDDAPAQPEPAVEQPASEPAASPPAPQAQPLAEPASPSPGTEERPGLLDPRESDAVSATVIPDAVPGRPLAAHGLQITTVRPHWPISTRLTRDPANPTARLTFSRAGRVINVEFVKPTGFEDVDEPLRTALYKWTATGAPLAALTPHADPAQPEPGLSITIRVVLQ